MSLLFLNAQSSFQLCLQKIRFIYNNVVSISIEEEDEPPYLGTGQDGLSLTTGWRISG